MSPITRIEADLLGFLLERQPRTVGIDTHSELLESGLLDSLLLMDLMLHIESGYGVLLSASDVTPANFRNISALAQLVARRSHGRNTSGEAA